MPRPLDLSSVRAKIDRAAEHLRTLDSIVGPGVDADAELSSQFDPTLQAHQLIHVGLPNTDRTDIGTIFGDFIHNTRSALDNLICALLRSNNVKIKQWHSYPLCLSSTRFDADVIHRDPARGPSCLDGLSDDQQQLVSLHQPYIGRDERRAKRSPLFLLHLAWNTDKHRLVHAGALNIATTPNVTLEPSPYFTLRSVTPCVRVGTFLEPGTVVALVQVAVVGTPPEGTMPMVHADQTASVAFRGTKGIPISHWDVRQMLRDATWAIRAFDHSFEVPW